MPRKPVSPPPPRLLELLDSRRPLVAPLVLALREQVLREAPGAIAAYEEHVNLGFDQGTSLDNTHGLLVGTGKKIRHIRIESKQDLKLPLKSYIREAIERAEKP